MVIGRRLSLRRLAAILAPICHMALCSHPLHQEVVQVLAAVVFQAAVVAVVVAAGGKKPLSHAIYLDKRCADR